MANLLQFRRAWRTKRAGKVAPGSRVNCAASLPSSWTACRAAKAVTGVGRGAPKDTVTRIRPTARRLPEKLPAREAEDAAPHAVQMDRDHRKVQPLDDLLHPALERQQVAGAGDRSFRENAHDVPGLELLARGLDRGDHRARSGEIDRNGPQGPEQAAERPVFVIRTPDDEARVTAPRGPSHQESVHQGDVIGYQQNAAPRRHMIGAQHPDAVQKRDQATDAEIGPSPAVSQE